MSHVLAPSGHTMTQNAYGRTQLNSQPATSTCTSTSRAHDPHGPRRVQNIDVYSVQRQENNTANVSGAERWLLRRTGSGK